MGLKAVASIRSSSGYSSGSLGSRDPLQTDDVNAGYSVNDLWINFSAKRVWQCLSNSAGIARWQQLTWTDAPIVDAVSTASANCVLAIGVRRLKNSYSGNLINVTRASDSTSSDIGQVNNALDTGSLDVFLAGTTGTIGTAYDQSGNTANMTQATAAKQPKVPPFNNSNGVRPMCIPGLSGGLTGSTYFLQNTGIATNNNALSVFMIGRIQNANSLQTIFSLGSSSRNFTVYSQNDHAMTLYPTTGGVSAFAEPLDSAAVFGVTTANPLTIVSNDNAVTATAGASSQANTGVNLGADSNSGNNTWPGSLDVYAFIVYSKSLSTAELTLFKTAAYIQFGIVPQVRQNLVFIGDSITAGFKAPYNTCFGRLIMEQLGVQGIITGRPSGTTTTELAATTPWTNFFRANQRYTVLVDLGTNDIASSDATAVIYPNLGTILADIRSAAATAAVASIRVGVATIIANTGNNVYQTNWNTLNSLVRANTAGFDFVVDFASDAILGSMANTSNTAYFVDGTHPTDLGHNMLADIGAPIMQSNL